LILVMPMAGRGARLEGAGMPKPLVEVEGRPMVAWALDGLREVPRTRTIFVVLAAHEREFGVSDILRRHAGPGISVIETEGVTQGQLCTVLLARDEIDGAEDVLIASCDTHVDSDIGAHIRERSPGTRGLISVAPMSGDRWSFARADDAGRVIEVAEKVRISPHASTGLYYFAEGAEFVGAADALIREDRRTNGEFYVIPVYDEYIKRGWEVRLSQARQMTDMGTPEAISAARSVLRGVSR
jgi:dTDP-glucose pyrophosphorylase